VVRQKEIDLEMRDLAGAKHGADEDGASLDGARE
jgi:hypothetical protein